MDLVSRIKERLHYDPENGQFTWKIAAGRRYAGKEAGGISVAGYRMIRIFRKRYFAHRLAFLMVTGKEPDDVTDHANGVRSDNRWANLRACSQRENMQNMRITSKVNTSSGLIGASWSKSGSKWQSQIRVDGKIKHLGYFSTPEDAHSAYVAAKRKHHALCTL
ncbi:MAG TPA: HNH endonuclease [Giesbergeria sp.]|nr:HNH endonuclease [Giesbergeria sp.]